MSQILPETWYLDWAYESTVQGCGKRYKHFILPQPVTALIDCGPCSYEYYVTLEVLRNVAAASHANANSHVPHVPPLACMKSILVVNTAKEYPIMEVWRLVSNICITASSLGLRRNWSLCRPQTGAFQFS